MAPIVTVELLFATAGFEKAGFVSWNGDTLPDSPGIYIITVDNPAKVTIGIPKKGEASAELIDGARLKWDGVQPIVYIGKAKVLKNRLKQFYAHKFGQRSPHAGGQSILLIQQQLSIYWVVVDSEAKLPSAEDKFLRTFESLVGRKPFGNRVKAAQPKQIS